MISELAKRMIPVSIKAYIKMGAERKQFAHTLSEIKNDKDEYDLLVGTAIHTNLGDHLITLSEKKLLSEINPNRKVYEIPTEMFQFYKKRIGKIVNSSCRIFINGGGWMGNLWPYEEKLLQNIVYTFYDHKITIFPQTIYYDEKLPLFHEFIDSGNRIFEKCSNLTLFVRDKQSFDFAKSKLKIKNIILVPDVALYYSTHFHKPKEKIIGLCLRDDREKSSDSFIIEKICDELKANGYNIVPISTMNQTRVPSFQRYDVCEQKLSDFSKYTAIITDRLHGMIFSYLSGSKCVIFDNKTKKVSGVYEQWLSGSNQIYPAYINSSVENIICYVQNRNCPTEKIDLTKDFMPLITEVKYGRD